MIRKSVLAKVYKALEKSSFTVVDFTIETPDKSDSILKITFAPNSDYIFQVQYVKTDRGKRLAKKICPGLHETEEVSYNNTFYQIEDDVTEWCRYIRDELRSTVPVYEEMDEIRKIIEDHISKNIDEPDEPFTQTEADILREKFDQLAKQFNVLQEKNKITEQQLKSLNREISTIKENLKGFPKGVWYKTAGTRLFGVMKKVITSKEGRNVLASAAKKALDISE